MRNAPGPPTTLARYQSSIPGSSPEAIGRPFTVSPCDTAASRASAVATSPVFCRPSPDTSITCRRLTRGCSANRCSAAAMPPPGSVIVCTQERPAPRRRVARVLRSSRPRRVVQGTRRRCSSAHSTTAISIVPLTPIETAVATSSLSRAAAIPSRWSLKRWSSTEPETSTASTRATSARSDPANAPSGTAKATARAAAIHRRLTRRLDLDRHTCRLPGWADSRRHPSFRPGCAAGLPRARRTLYRWRGSDAVRLTCIHRYGVDKRSRPKRLHSSSFITFSISSHHPLPYQLTRHRYALLVRLCGRLLGSTRFSLASVTCHFVNEIG